MTLLDDRPRVVTPGEPAAPPAPQGSARRLRGGLRTALIVAAFVIALAAVAAAAALLTFPHMRMTAREAEAIHAYVIDQSWKAYNSELGNAANKREHY